MGGCVTSTDDYAWCEREGRRCGIASSEGAYGGNGKVILHRAGSLWVFGYGCERLRACDGVRHSYSSHSVESTQGVDCN